LYIVNKNNELARIDLFSSKCGDYNALLAGKSGSGKTILVEHIIKDQSISSGKAFIIEEGGTYKSLCKELGGNYVEFNRFAPVCINPFAFINFTQMKSVPLESIFSVFEEFSHEIVAITDILVLMIGNEKLDQSDIKMLEMAVIETIKHQSNKATITTVTEYLSASDNMERAGKMIEWLQPYTSTGEYSAFFEGEYTKIVEDQLNVFELDGLAASPKLRDIVLCTLIFILNQMMKLEPSKYNICIIEELYSLFKTSKISPQFIENSFRLARLTNGSFISVTEAIDDYSVNDTLTSMYKNSTWRLFLKHENLIESSKLLDKEELQTLQSLDIQLHNFSDLMVTHGKDAKAVYRLNIVSG